MGHVMLSYSHQDENFVELLEADLKEKHHGAAPPWRDRSDIDGGAEWKKALEAAVDEAYVVLVVCSGSSKESKWVKREWQRAIRSETPIIPLQLEAGGVPITLRKFQIVDFSGVTHSEGLEQVKHYRLAFEKLVQAVDKQEPVIRFTRELSSADLKLRSEAARALGEAQDASAIEPLIGALRDEDANVRYEAARALGRLQGEGAARSLVLALADEDADVCAAAAWSLGALESAEAINHLTGLLTHEDRIVRETVALALGRILAHREGEGSAAVRPLISALRSDPISSVRDAARDALDKVGGEEAVKALARVDAFAKRFEDAARRGAGEAADSEE